MNDLRKAAEMALKALEMTEVVFDADGRDFGLARVSKAREALRQALAQPEQEPFEYWNAAQGWVKIDEVQQHFDSVGCGTIYKTPGENRVPLYKTPPSIEAAVLAEREACAKVCDAESQRARWNWENDILKNQTFWNGGEQLASSCAAAIRARGEK